MSISSPPVSTLQGTLAGRDVMMQRQQPVCVASQQFCLAWSGFVAGQSLPAGVSPERAPGAPGLHLAAQCRAWIGVMDSPTGRRIALQRGASVAVATKSPRPCKGLWQTR